MTTSEDACVTVTANAGTTASHKRVAYAAEEVHGQVPILVKHLTIVRFPAVWLSLSLFCNCYQTTVQADGVAVSHAKKKMQLAAAQMISGISNLAIVATASFGTSAIGTSLPVRQDKATALQATPEVIHHHKWHRYDRVSW